VRAGAGEGALDENGSIVQRNVAGCLGTYKDFIESPLAEVYICQIIMASAEPPPLKRNPSPPTLISSPTFEFSRF